jgi:ADP-ribose pyrophosphatase YjhB (NUDIX family)
MPGGAAEIGSSFASTAISELREETGLIAKEEDLIAFACISRPDIHILRYSNGDTTHAFAMWFLLKHWSGTLATSADEVEELKFFPLSNPPTPLLKPTSHAIGLYLEYMRTGTFQIS